MLFILFLFRARGRALRGLAPALVVGGLLVLAAVGASSTEAVAKGAFLRWQQWDLYDRPDKAVSVSYVWTSNYDGLRFPKKKTVVMRVKVDGPRRPLYWRATVLEDYNGGTWNETGDLSEPKPSREEIDVGSDDPLLSRRRRRRGELGRAGGLDPGAPRQPSDRIGTARAVGVRGRAPTTRRGRAAS